MRCVFVLLALALTTLAGPAFAAEVKVALSNSFGLGGQNACLVLRAAPD